jgi:hypothetical protein
VVEVVQVTVQAQQLFWFFLFFWLSSRQLLYGNSLNNTKTMRKNGREITCEPFFLVGFYHKKSHPGYFSIVKSGHTSNHTLLIEHILYRSDKSPEGNEYTWEQLVMVQVVQDTVRAQQLFWFSLFFW